MPGRNAGGRSKRVADSRPGCGAGRESGLGPRLTRRRLIVAGAALAVVGVGARIGYVNATATPQPEVVHHAVGEWVDLDGAFANTAAMDQTEGYFVRVSSVEVMSYNDYLARYAYEEQDPVPGLDAPSVLCVTFDMRNEGSAGGLYLFGMYAVAATKRNAYLQVESDLYAYSEPRIDPGTVFLNGISIKEGTEYTTHLPYRQFGSNGMVDIDGIQYNSGFTEALYDTRYELILSYLPVRHVVDIEIELP